MIPDEIELMAGLMSGITIAILFNPIDKAQYTGFKNNISFYNFRNFDKPFSGTFNSCTTKIISNGLYFSCIDMIHDRLKKSPMTPFQQQFIAYNLAGSICSVVSNPLSVIKYRNWDKHYSTWRMSQELYQQGGWRVFSKGIEYRLMRDITFSSIYAISHYYGHRQWGDGATSFLVDNVAIATATTLSAPFNFAMNYTYAMKPYHPHPTMGHIGQVFQTELAKVGFWKMNSWNRVQYLGKRFQLGVGNFRVSLGITLGHRFYGYFKDNLTP